jgi:hypothetical protein
LLYIFSVSSSQFSFSFYYELFGPSVVALAKLFLGVGMITSRVASVFDSVVSSQKISSSLTSYTVFGILSGGAS